VTSVCNPGTTSQSRDFGIGILQSRDPGINHGIENPVKQPMATNQASINVEVVGFIGLRISTLAIIIRDIIRLYKPI